MSQRNFSNNAVETQLVVPVSDTAGSFVVTSVTGWPAVPFTILIDPDQPEEEACLVTFMSGTTLTVTRGFNSTVALPHASGAVVKHAALSIDFTEANLHVNATDAVHGVLGDIVGTTDTQTLTNKAISGSNNTITDIAQSSVTGLDDSFALKADLAGPTFTGTVTLPSTTSIGPVTSTEIGYVDGVTSNIQTQFDNMGALVNEKAPINSPTFTGTVTLPSSTSVGGVSAGELAALDGVTGNVQSQINSVAALVGGGGTIIIPAGGTTGQVLAKASDTDYDLEWVDAGAGGGGGYDIVTSYPSGGTVTTWTDPSTSYVWRIHRYNYSGAVANFTVGTAFTGQMLAVGGGGQGGQAGGFPNNGGYPGGAGALWMGDWTFGAGTHTLWVGNGHGAPGGGSGQGADGGHTYFDGYPGNTTSGTLICYGGGGGSPSWYGGSNAGSPGGSGGSGTPGGLGTGGVGNPAGTVFFYNNGDPSGSGGANGVGPGSGMASTITGTSISFASGNGIRNINGVGVTADTGQGGTGYDMGSAGGTIIIRYRIA